uniref:Putative secreted protein n=1 Tax=Anopheles triannulatus TaxID=58253 RepID=A0A2M4B216_9DIPT
MPMLLLVVMMVMVMMSIMRSIAHSYRSGTFEHPLSHNTQAHTGRGDMQTSTFDTHARTTPVCTHLRTPTCRMWPRARGINCFARIGISPKGAEPRHKRPPRGGWL